MMVLHRPPNAAGTPRWEACQDCGEMIRTDDACPIEQTHDCYSFAELRARGLLIFDPRAAARRRHPAWPGGPTG